MLCSLSGRLLHLEQESYKAKGMEINFQKLTDHNAGKSLLLLRTNLLR
jgi:hypothetical protein